MLPRQSRLTEEKDFLRVYQKGQRVSSKNLRFFVLRTGQRSNRFGFVISKKAVSHSTGRNRVKRILRAVARLSLPHLKTGHDIIIQGFPGSATSAPQDLREEVKKFFVKAHLLL